MPAYPSCPGKRPLNGCSSSSSSGGGGGGEYNSVTVLVIIDTELWTESVSQCNSVDTSKPL